MAMVDGIKIGQRYPHGRVDYPCFFGYWLWPVGFHLEVNASRAILGDLHAVGDGASMVVHPVYKLGVGF